MNKRVVIKIGSSLLSEKGGGLSFEKLDEHVKAIAAARGRGIEIILVTSGAIAAGFKKLGLHSRPASIVGKQAAAAIGQGLLMQAYNQAFERFGTVTAQILLNRRDFTIRESYNNAYNTLSELLDRGVLPVINENDSVATSGVAKFGDNDMLAALVSGLMRAEMLVIFTDVDGLYDGNPASAGAKRIEALSEITPETLKYAISDSGESKLGTGGMLSKLKAAQLGLSLGTYVFVGAGSGENKILDVISGKGEGTYFGKKGQAKVRTKRQWIAFHADASGSLIIDAGARRALVSGGKSLLPAGVVERNGNFSRGDVVRVMDEEGTVLGRGIINYSHVELDKVRGKHTRLSKDIIGVSRSEVIHRNDWICLLDEIRGASSTQAFK